MVYSDYRKLGLSGWLQEHDSQAYGSSLQLQKFLFFYESFSKVAGDSADFVGLKGYKHGPVFSTVWGDYTKNREEFDCKAAKVYHSQAKEINDMRALRSDFIVNALPVDELSEFTHSFNIWRAKKSVIEAGEKQVALYESDFNDSDFRAISMLERMYPDDLVVGSIIVPVGGKRFVFSREDAKRLTDQHRSILCELAEHEKDLYNPVFVDIDEKGVLCVD